MIINGDSLSPSVGNKIEVPDGFGIGVGGVERLRLGNNGFYSAGSVVQVVSVTKSDANFSTTSTSLVDITGLSVTITPKNINSKILVMCSIARSHSTTTNNCVLTITDSSNNILIAPDSPIGSRTASFISEVMTNVNSVKMENFSFLHSPNTISPFTYKIRTLVSGGTMFINRDSTNTDTSIYGRNISTLTLMEIGG